MMMGYLPPQHFVAKNIYSFHTLYAKLHFTGEQILHLTPLRGHFSFQFFTASNAKILLSPI